MRLSGIVASQLAGQYSVVSQRRLRLSGIVRLALTFSWDAAALSLRLNLALLSSARVKT
jgi:hypothetical protein